MKRNILAVILVLFAFSFIHGQNNTPIDLVLLLNTSSAMSSSYENVNNYITGSFLSEFLRVGDTFHLIAFSQSPRLDIARRISQRGDVETIIGRMLLQYPVENGNNLVAAIAFTENYVSSLPSRPKKIVLVSTGGQDISSVVNAAKESFKTKNATFDFVQITSGQPLANLPKSGRETASAGVVTSGTASTSVSSSGTTSTAHDGVSQTESITSSAATSASTGVSETGTTVQNSSASKDTSTAESGGIADNSNVSDQEKGTQTEAVSEKKSGSEIVSVNEKRSSNQKASGESSAFSIPFIAIIVILILLVLGFIIFFASRKLGSGPSRSASQQKDELPPFVDHSKELASYAAVQSRQRTTPYSDRPVKQESQKPAVINPTGTLIVNMFVEDQSLSIGKRNIHSLKSGYSLSVGGGKSDFLIFLVPIPPSIGELRRNGSQLTFIPRKPKYFPDLGSAELRDCLNKTIRIISDKNYEIRFRFEMYEDPLLALNRILHSIKVPG